MGKSTAARNLPRLFMVPGFMFWVSGSGFGVQGVQGNNNLMHWRPHSIVQYVTSDPRERATSNFSDVLISFICIVLSV